MNHLDYHVGQLCNKSITIVDGMNLTMDEIILDMMLSSAEITIVDCASTYMIHIPLVTMYETLANLSITKKWLIATSDYTYYKRNHPGIVYYPIYLIDGIDKGTGTYVELNDARSNSIGFLSFHLHSHRLLCLIALHKKGWVSSSLLNLPAEHEMEQTSQFPAYKNALYSLDDIEKAELTQLLLMAPIVADAADDQIDITNIKNRAFSDAYINLLTESDYPRAFITEKSIKPFLAGQFTAVIASPGMNAHLQELGFDMMADYINLEFATTNIRNNINDVIEQIEKLIPNIEQAWVDTYLQRLHNYQLIRSPALRAELCRELKERL